MCRLFGFRSVIQSQVHRSLVQADNALGQLSTDHPDGWGVAYYVDGAPHVTRSPSAAIDDHIFHRVSGVVASETVIAHVRKATVGGLNVLNCHPFQYGRWVFAHNGEIKKFDDSREALVNTTSVIDTIAAEHAYVQDGVTVIPIGGIAYASSRGISKVEIKIDNGDWIEADRRTPISETTWTIWRYDWPFEAGDHTFSVRCTDGNGDLQTNARRGVRPDGATGIYSIEREIKSASNET